MKKKQIFLYMFFGIVMLIIGIGVGTKLPVTDKSPIELSDLSNNNLAQQDESGISINGETNSAQNFSNVQSEEAMNKDALDETSKESNSESSDNMSDESSSQSSNNEEELALTEASIRAMFNLDNEYSKVVISPNKKNVSYIDMLSFESLGNAFFYDGITSKTSAITMLDYEQPNTVKDIIWINDERLALIIGYRNGTITQGGSIYVYDSLTQKINLVYEAQEKMEYVKLEWIGTQIKCKTVKWLDDNMTEYVYEDIYFTSEELK